MPSPMLETFSNGLTAACPLTAVYRARTEPQIRHYVHGCDHVSNVALTIPVIAVRYAEAIQQGSWIAHNPTTLVVGY